MNYIKKLEMQVAARDRALAEANELVSDFLAHLESPKFYDDRTIQIMDVVSRLREIRMATLP